MSAAGIHKQEIGQMNNSFIVPKYISAPNTTIQNRAQVLDSANMLQAFMGTERISFRGINLLPKEFGANGDPVWEIDTKDQRIRLVGPSWTWINDGYGGSPDPAAVTTAYIEFIFYGTALNLLFTLNAGTWNFGVTIDGGSETLFSFAGSNTNNNFGYKNNNQVNIASGLSIGWHSVKVRNNGSLSFLLGVEFINAVANLAITPGQAFIGNKKESLLAGLTSSYNSGIVGTKGARVVKYLLNGTTTQAIQECAVSPSYLASANHANEELVRKINFREFGALRADDFSTLSTARASAFALEDNQTMLVASNHSAASQTYGIGLAAAVNGAFIVLTFVGTGLDLLNVNPNVLGGNTVYIDGTLVGDYSGSQANGGMLKICSGLPYGSHTVKIINTSGAGINPQDFYIYQPKKPTIPVGAIEICDYNVVANYVGVPNTSADDDNNFVIGQGMIRKGNMREMFFKSTAWTTTLAISTSPGWTVSTTTSGEYMEIWFYGTGFEIACSYNSVAPSATLQIDGTNYVGSAIAKSVAGASTWTPGTSTWLISGGAGSRLEVTGLTLGLHKIRLTKANATDTLKIHTFDFITPIHVNHSSLSLGSLSLFDNAKIQAALTAPPSGLDEARKYDIAYAQYYYNMSAFRTSGNKYFNNTNKPILVTIQGGNGGNIDFYVDNILASQSASNSANTYPYVSVLVPAGSSYYATAASFQKWYELR